MPLSDIPSELLLKIANHLDAAATNTFACTNRGLHNLLNAGLYCWDVTQPLSRSLIWGAKKGVEGTIQWAVDAAPKVNPCICFHIALQTAAQQGHVPIVELLLKVDGIDPNFEGGELQAAPLILAAEEGHSAIVELLLAAVNIDANVRNKHFDCTPLMYACRKGHISIVQQLLARTDVDFNARGSYGTPLIAACGGGHPKIINLLLAKDSIEINLAHAGTTPFIAAARMGLVEVVESLLAREKFDPNVVTEFGECALEDAAGRGDVNVMKLLLNRPDVDPNLARGFDGNPPLILGALFPDVVKLLLRQQGIEVNYQNNSSGLSTALIKTACSNCVESAKLLLGRDDIKVNIPNSAGLTALHCACLNESLEVVDLLLERDDIDLNPRDVDDLKTPLALACRNKENGIPIIRSLLSRRNTDPNILNKNGDSILADFMKYRHEMDSRYADEIESLLRNAGASL
ncbi:Ankyrin repeat-containing domain protein [Elaphomyces granulatus]|jgi:ankyrin repeat protein